MKQDINLLMEQIKELIEKKLLLETAQLKATDDLALTLGIDPERDLPLLVSHIEQTYDLSTEAKSLLLQANTLHQLASIVIEETELG